MHETSSPLIYTLLGPMNHPRGLCTTGESKPESSALTLVHQISRYGLHHKKKEVFLEAEETSTNILTKHYHQTLPPNPHTRSKIIPL